MRILHVSPHLGGGVGNVISGVCIHDKNNLHSIMCLEDPINRQYYDVCIENNIDVLPYENVVKTIKQFDIVQIEWWHHPLIAEFMVKYLNDVKTRLVIWSHISGCNYPRISYDFVNLPDAFIFATPYSYDNTLWSSEELKIIKDKSYMVISSGNNFAQTPKKKVAHESYNVGYVGFLGYEKTNPDFVKICERCADIDNINFIIVGDLKYGADLVRDVNSSKYKDKFIFKGYSNNVANEFINFDVFACLLQNAHTGASENALLEAMYYGVCPVVFKQCTEQYLVKHNVTGIICKDEIAFVDSIHELYLNYKKREELGYCASKYVRENLNISNTIENLQAVYNKVYELDKNYHNAFNVFGKTPYDWFTSCYKGELNNISGLAAGDSKGSLKQFNRYFNDEKLKRLIEVNNL